MIAAIKRPKNNMQTLDLPTSFAPQSRGYELDTSPVAFGYLDSALCSTPFLPLSDLLRKVLRDTPQKTNR